MPYNKKKKTSAGNKKDTTAKKVGEIVVTEDPTVKIEQEGANLLVQVEALVVVDADDYAQAANLRKMAKQHIKMVKDTMKDSKTKAKAAHAAVVALEKELKAPAEAVVTIVDQKMLAWNAEQERIQQEAQAEAEAARAEELRTLVEEGADDEDIVELSEAPIVAEEVYAQSAPTGTGATIRKTWKGECTNMIDLIAEVAAGNAPTTFLDINQSAMDAYAKEHGEESSIKGYRAYQQSSIAGTR